MSQVHPVKNQHHKKMTPWRQSMWRTLVIWMVIPPSFIALDTITESDDDHDPKQEETPGEQGKENCGPCG